MIPRCARVGRAVVALCGLVVAAAGLVAPGTPARAAGTVPAQFVAKLYTEALGRMPDASGWSFFLDSFATNGCNVSTIGQDVRAFYESSEFLGLGYDDQERLLTLYRGALNREPDQSGLDNFTGQLDAGTVTWDQVVDTFASSSELAGLVPAICGGNPSYYYGTEPAPDLTPVGSGFSGTGEQLQAALDATPAGGTVYLAQKAVVRLTSMLVIPAGVTLATTGLPAPSHYASQGRLVRAASFDDALVRLSGGAKLLSVWVDGQRGAYTNFVQNAIDVQLMGGDGTTVSGSKVSNSMGWSSLQAFGTYEGLPCASTTVTGNLVTAYSSEHFPHGGTGRWTDGLSVACEHALVAGNGVVDATDVGIVLFRANPAVQTSTVRDNLVLAAGNSAYGALAADAVYDQGTTPDFTGAVLAGNAFWTGPATHFDVGLAVGTREWFGTRSDTGHGIAVTGNTTNGLSATVGTGIAVTGMDDATVQGNQLTLSVQPVSSCPHVTFGVDADGYATGGDFQPGATPVHFLNPSGGGCIGHTG